MTAAAPAPRVQIVHYRDPDSGCDVAVYVDGVLLPADQVTVEDIDPGAGYDWEESGWGDRLEAARDAAEEGGPYELAVYEALLVATDSEYVTGKPADWEDWS